MAPWINCSVCLFAQWHGHASVAAQFSQVKLSKRSVRAVLEEIRVELGAESIEQVIYALVRRLPSQPLPIIGSGKIVRVQSAIAALSLELSREQWYRVWVAS